MTDFPIIMSEPMVLAMLREAAEAGTGKQMTRRLAWRREAMPEGGTFPSRWRKRSPWCAVKPGDRLWIKEKFWRHGRWAATKDGGKVRHTFEPWPWIGGDVLSPSAESAGLVHAAGADDTNSRLRGKFGQAEPAWHLRPSIFLERHWSRLTLIVTSVKIERLQDISEQDCEREGVRWNAARRWWEVPGAELPSGAPIINSEARLAFACLWDAIHGPGAWAENPEVVAVGGRVHLRNVDSLRTAA